MSYYARSCRRYASVRSFFTATMVVFAGLCALMAWMSNVKAAVIFGAVAALSLVIAGGARSAEVTAYQYEAISYNIRAMGIAGGRKADKIARNVRRLDG